MYSLLVEQKERIASRFLSNERHIFNHPNVYAMYTSIYIYINYPSFQTTEFFDFRPLERKFC